MQKFELSPEALYKKCDLDHLGFETTDELRPTDNIVGQKRAKDSLHFGLGIKAHGYNIFVSGPTGTGRRTYVKALATKIAKTEPIPSDWIYVYNFDDPTSPIAIELPAGSGKELKNDMTNFVKELKEVIPKAFEGKEYEQQRQEIVKETNEKKTKIWDELLSKAKKSNLTVQQNPTGFLILPLRDGKVMSREEYEALDENAKAEIAKHVENLREELSVSVKEMRKFEKEEKKRLEKLNREVASFVLTPMIDELKEKYSEIPKLLEHFDKMKQDILSNLNYFQSTEEKNLPMPAIEKRYFVNLLVDNSRMEGAPVVVETNPTYHNLFGRIEYETQMFFAFTDFTMIRPGSIHRANGGYLILQAEDLLRNVGAWEGLKRALTWEKIRVENLQDHLGISTIKSLRPSPIPLNIKVILIGSNALYDLLKEYDEDFTKLFKVRAMFDSEMPKNKANILKYARFIASVCKRHSLPPFTSEAVASVVEYGSRLVNSQKKLSTQFNKVMEVVIEAGFEAKQRGGSKVLEKDVKKAMRNKEYRTNLVREKIREMYSKGKILVEVKGEKVGQINGLSIFYTGEHSFGFPVKITARTFTGEKGVINIEREVNMSGNIHSKGVLILSGYLSEKYSSDTPLSFEGTLCFEQTYGGVEGDSASLAELLALISSLGKVPVRQDIAVTGSINQFGEVQPVGGLNEKIEGFYEVCKLKGLTGTQGVIIPSKNVDELMLKEEVIESVRKGEFFIYAVKDVDEAIELMTGKKAGKRHKDGNFTADSVHQRVLEQLKTWAKGRKKKK